MTALNTIWMWIRQGTTPAAAEPIAAPPPAATPSQAPAMDSVVDKETPMADIHDIKPILDMGSDWQWLIYSLAGLVLLLGLLALAWWLWKRRQKTEVTISATPPGAPDTEALRALDALAAERGLDPKLFYFRLSAVLRRYVERRFNFPAAEMTTEELLPQVDRLPLDPMLTQGLKTFCREADPIKFAGATAQRERLNNNLEFCRLFVRKTTVSEMDTVDTKAVKLAT